MSLPVKLSDIADAMQMQSDEIHQYLNRQTGELISVTDEEISAAEADEPLDDYPDWQRENIMLAGEILGTENYLALPDRFEINEYDMMERFCLALKDENVSAAMLASIKGSGAFRRFKDNLYHYGLDEQWYQYRDNAYREIAKSWCEEHEIPYVEDK